MDGGSIEWANWALVLVGIFGVTYAIKTLKAIKRQAKANEHMLAEIRAAGHQTDRLIEQAEKHADAARKSADALVKAERAWLMVDVEWETPKGHLSVGSQDGSFNTTAFVTLAARNQGRTPVWIAEWHAKFEIANTVPPKPDISGAEIHYGPHPVAVGASSELALAPIAAGCPGLNKIMLIYGVVKYRDVFTREDELRETWFGYLIPPSERLERLAHPEYNKNT